MQPADDLGTGPAEPVAAVHEQPQRDGGVIDHHEAQTAAAQAGHSHAVGVDRVGFAALTGVEHPHPGGQLGRHVQHRLAVRDQALGDMPADPSATLDCPDPVREPATGLKHLLVAVRVSTVPAVSLNLLALVDDLDRGRPLMRIHPNNYPSQRTFSSHAPLWTMARRATLLRAGQTPLEPLLAAVTGGHMPNQSHTQKPWTAACESDPPATSTQPGRAEVVDQVEQVAPMSWTGTT